MKGKKEESPNWNKFYNTEGSISGYPFREGFPSGGIFNTISKEYRLILRDGTRADATVDYSMQYLSEGIQWITVNDGIYSQDVVAAWKEK